MQNEKTLAIVRLVVGLIALINVVLAARGYQEIELDEGLITTVISGVIAICTYLWSWWKNNNITKAAQKAQTYKNEIDDDIRG